MANDFRRHHLLASEDSSHASIDASQQNKPPSAVSTDVRADTKAASSLTDGSPANTMAMAKQFLAAMEKDDDLKQLFKTALGSASPTGDGIDG